MSNTSSPSNSKLTLEGSQADIHADTDTYFRKTAEPAKTTSKTPNLPPRNRAAILPKREDISQALSEISHHDHRIVDLLKFKQAGVFIPSFRGSLANMQEAILRHFVEEFVSSSAAVLNFLPGDEEFRLFAQSQGKGIPPISRDIIFSSKAFKGIAETMNTKPQIPTIFNENIENWRQIFPHVSPPPCVLILIPYTVSYTGPRRGPGSLAKMPNTSSSTQLTTRSSSPPKSSPIPTSTISYQTISTCTVLAYNTTTLPKKFLLESTWDVLLSDCHLNAPVLVNGDRYEEKLKEAKRFENIMDGVRAVKKHIQDIGGCANDIGLELQHIFGSQHAVIYILHQDGDEPIKLNKYAILGPVKIDSSCPDKASHSVYEFKQGLNYPAGCAAEKQKCIRINDEFQLRKECGTDKLHSFGSCLVKNMMCVFIKDQTNDMSLVIELSNKTGGFTENDEEDAKLFASLVGDVLSSSVMLEYRRNAIRRCDITNKVVNNITKVQFKKVRKLLDFQFRNSIYFSKRFYTMKFTFNQLPREQYTGVILFMFSELGFLKRWKMRKATVIRFILSLSQGYIENSYHNWKHACTVTHCAFHFLKKMDLTSHGYLTDLEALSLVIACLCHDIGHRGLNNHFGVFADKDDAKHLKSQETSLAERHHVALALQILATEDCNIVENMTDAEYGQFVELVQFAIIATDLSKHLLDRADHFKTMKKFVKRKKEHRRVFLSILMTACDMGETIKPWDDYICTVKNIFYEFFEQGEEELKLGFTPTPIMDARIAYIPYIELKFIDEIVRPVYEAIAELCPKTEEALIKIDYFKELWLVSTNVFDDHVLTLNPLEVLLLPEMREELLKREVNRELEKIVNDIRKSKRFTNPFNVQMSKRGTMAQNIADLPTFPSSTTSLSEKGCGQRRIKALKRSIQGICCCRRCRHRALYNAEYVRRMKQEACFMEQRSDEYEKTRIIVLFPSQFPDGIHPRDRIESLINPNADRTDSMVSGNK